VSSTRSGRAWGENREGRGGKASGKRGRAAFAALPIRLLYAIRFHGLPARPAPGVEQRLDLLCAFMLAEPNEAVAGAREALLNLRLVAGGQEKLPETDAAGGVRGAGLPIR
jgi:hypothetical protein